jgi:hypothetical protein
MRETDLLKEPTGGGLWRDIPPDASPFVAEGFFETGDIEIVPGLFSNIIAWTVPPNSFAVLQYYSLLPSLPVAYYDCLFDLTVDGRRVNNIQFTQIQDGQERPPDFVRVFTEGQVIALRLFRRVVSPGGLISGGPSLVFVARLAGKHWSRRGKQ